MNMSLIDSNISNLLVIGNGLDLSAGLKSSFKDFYESRRNTSTLNILDSMMNINHISAINVHDLSQVESKTLTYWDYIFSWHKNKPNTSSMDWMDIESIIKFEINDPKSPTNIAFGFLGRKMAPMSDFYKRQIIIILNELFTLKNIRTEDDLYKYLLTELKKLEIHFCEYLKDNIQKTTSYREKLNIIFSELTLGLMSNVLNFNYTDYKGHDYINQCENVHGSLSTKSIIFGIDSEKVDSDNPAFRFTKTYRKIENQILENQFDHPKFLDKNIKSIIFYGHSLSEADHSYFQSIFDYYSISTSAVNIIFVYKVYDPEIADLIKYSYMSKVIKLLEKYRNTITNERVRENLIHRLLIEKRLYIVNYDLLNTLAI